MVLILLLLNFSLIERFLILIQTHNCVNVLKYTPRPVTIGYSRQVAANPIEAFNYPIKFALSGGYDI